MGTFPRISIAGSFILAGYLSIMIFSFANSMHGTALISGDLELYSSIWINSLMMASAALNASSHSAVVLGALNDTYVISILLGVGFDVLTQILRLIWWIHLSMISINSSNGINYTSTGFICLLTVVSIFQMHVHLLALRMNSSRERLEKVLTGALNNLRGIPGPGYKDHIFAYMDLGEHLSSLILSGLLLYRQESLVVAFEMLLLMILLAYAALSRIPLNQDAERSLSLIQILDDGSIVCACDACTIASKRRYKKSSFVFGFKEGVCELWLYSFETLSEALCSSTSRKTS